MRRRDPDRGRRDHRRAGARAGGPDAAPLAGIGRPPRGRPARRAVGGGCAARLGRLHQLSIRLLGDGVLRRRAWDVATSLGWASTYDAEYIALTQLQADAFVTMDANLARRVEGIVAVASIDALQ